MRPGNTYRKYYLFLILVQIFLLSNSFCQADDQLELAKKAFIMNAYDKALSHLDVVLKNKPNSDEALFFRGKCKIEMDMYNDALDNFAVASNLDPQEPEYYFYKGICEWKLKRMQVAIKSIEKSLLYDPSNAIAYKVLGSIYYELNLHDLAKQNFDKAIESQGTAGDAKTRKSKVEDNLEAYKTAIRQANRETAKDPNNSIAFLYKGILKLIGKDNYGAYQDLTKAAEINPDLNMTYFYKGYVEYKMKKYKEALEDLHKYSKKAPNDESAKKFMTTVEEASKMKVMDDHESNEVLLIAEEMPEFNGGPAALQKFIAENIQYPKEAAQLRLQGRVIVSFIIDGTGQIKNVELLKGIGGGCELEAMRIVSKMPKWKPGKQNGKPVSVRYTLPIKFALTSE